MYLPIGLERQTKGGIVLLIYLHLPSCSHGFVTQMSTTCIGILLFWLIQSNLTELNCEKMKMCQNVLKIASPVKTT